MRFVFDDGDSVMVLILHLPSIRVSSLLPLHRRDMHLLRWLLRTMIARLHLEMRSQPACVMSSPLLCSYVPFV